MISLRSDEQGLLKEASSFPISKIQIPKDPAKFEVEVFKETNGDKLKPSIEIAKINKDFPRKKRVQNENACK